MEFLNINNPTAVEEYEAFVQNHPKGHFCQSVMWAKLKTEWKFEAVIVRDAEGEICGTMGILVRKVPVFPTAIMYAPRGPVCDVHNKAVMEQLVAGAKEIADKHNAYVLRMDTDVKSDDTEFAALCQELGFTLPQQSKNFEGIQPRYVFRLYPEGRNEEELMASFHSKTRYNIRVAIKKGVEVKLADESAVDDFHRIMLETGLRDNFVIRTPQYFKRLLQVMGEHARLYMAYLDGRPIAGTIAIAYGDKVWYLYGASSNADRNAMPNYLLQMEMIKWAVERGARVYDFRGVSGDLTPENPLYGLYLFKKGFSGDFTEFCGEFEMVFSKPVYMAATKGIPLVRNLRRKLVVGVRRLTGKK
jgi:lipid II:glycine glycyltransferase (peptidoglycan interpeptide bridge formation enzyme)